MKNLFIYLLLSVSIASSYAAKIKVACVGNSITAGVGVSRTEDTYPYILQSLLGSTDYEVKNFGSSGATLLMTPQELIDKGLPYVSDSRNVYKPALNYNPDILIIKLGTNDSHKNNWKYKSYFKQDYIDFVYSFKDRNPDLKVYLCYPMPIFSNDPNGYYDPVVVNEVIPLIDEVAEIVKPVAVIDLHTPMVGRGDCSSDRLHPNAKGMNIIARTIFQTLCPGCTMPSLPENIFVKLSDSDFTQKAKNITSSLPEDTDLSVLTDKNAGTGIDVPFTADTWFMFEMPATFQPTAYSITVKSNDGKNNPLSWKLQSSGNGTSNWTDIDTKTNQAFFDVDSRLITISGTSSNKYFRLLVQANNGGENLHIADFQLSGHFVTPETSLTGTITAEFAGVGSPWYETIDKVVDKSFSTKYCADGHATGWIQYELPAATYVDRYAITSANGSDRNPKNWEFLGSPDGNRWATLDTRNDQDFLTNFSTMEYKIKTPKEYKYYRLKVTKNNGNSTYFELAEWQLFARTPSSIGKQAIMNYSVFIYPNPVKNEFSINSEQQPESVEILNAEGKIIKSFTQKTNPYNVNDIPAGLYFVRIKTDEYHVVKFVK